MVQLQRLAIAPNQINNQQIDLTAEQQHYLGRVLRLKPGDRFIILDGIGHGWLAKLNVTLPATPPQAEILETITIKTELPIDLTVLAAIPKGSGFEEIVRCATELGVTQLIPILSERTLVKPSEQKLLRWRRIVTEAAEQSERQIVPTLLEPMSWKAALSHLNAENNIKNPQRYLCVARGNIPHLCNHLPSQLSSNPVNAITIATGPEGGWTEAEIQAARSVGFQPVSLGDRILRAVTAPIVAVSMIVGMLERDRE
ncbi:MAG: 16S rRNA (uracil(1498)-N(3))-methyltransferase [Microcoleaceae cyanobacterium]